MHLQQSELRYLNKVKEGRGPNGDLRIEGNSGSDFCQSGVNLATPIYGDKPQIKIGIELKN